MSTESCVIPQLIGRVFDKVEGRPGTGVLRFTAGNGYEVVFHHDQDCCEKVEIVDIVGDLHDLEGSPVVMAECATNSDGAVLPPEGRDWQDCFVWTFYKFATTKGYVTVRWLGQSNGYYSMSVDMLVTGPKEV